jgi:O-antigen/teichoic acid export membrane protein
MGQNLKSQTISGMIWSAVQKFGNMGISFISNIVLARMLTPDDYGCIGMLAIFIVISNTFVDGGFGSALIQKKEPTQQDYSTIFWWNLFVSFVLYFVLYLAAPVIADFYHIPLLSFVLRVQGIVLIINSLNIIQTNQLRKQLKFKRLANVTIIAHIVAAISAIVLAWNGWGVWALVAQQIIANSGISIMLWFLNKWLPDFSFSKESFKQLFGFGSFILLANLINTFCNNIQGLLIGRFFSSTVMGYYAQALKLEDISSKSFASIVDQVSYPVLSKFQSDNDAMKSVLRKLVVALFYVAFPLMLVLILLAEPIIMLLYGVKWLPSVHYFQILCVGGIAVSLQGLYYFAVASKGKSKSLLVWTIIKRGIGLLVVLLGMYFGGINGLLWGSAAVAWIILFSNAYLVRKYINYTFLEQIRDLFPIVLLSICIFILLFIVNSFFTGNLYFKAFIIFLLYIVLYIGISFFTKIKALFSLLEILRNFKNKN